MNQRQKRRKISTNYSRFIPSARCKHCELCNGARGGVRGNNIMIDGKRVCDYCHASMTK